MKLVHQPYHIPMIRSGSKTMTTREWDECNLITGNVYMAAYRIPDVVDNPIFMSHDQCDCYVRVLDTYERTLGDYTTMDAQQEGDYESLADFMEGYERVYDDGAWDPEKNVWSVEYEYAGRSLEEAGVNTA